MAGSVLVAVKQAIVDGLTTAINDSSVSVTYAYEGADERRRREQVFFGAARATHEVAALKSGRLFREEELDVDLVVLVAAPGKTQAETDDRAFTIGTAVEEFLADNKGGETLGVAGLTWLRVTRMDHTPMHAPNGAIAEIVFTLRYHARLT